MIAFSPIREAGMRAVFLVSWGVWSLQDEWGGVAASSPPPQLHTVVKVGWYWRGPMVRTADSFGMSSTAPESSKGFYSAPHPPPLMLLKQTGLTVPCWGSCEFPSLSSIPWFPRCCGIIEWFLFSSLNCSFSHNPHLPALLAAKYLISSLPSQNMMTGCQRLSCHPTSGNSLPKVIFCLFPKWFFRFR